VTPDSRPAPQAPVRELREAARQQARKLSAGLGLTIAVAAALLAVVFFVLLDYRLNQAPHRLYKILAGIGLFCGILMRPRVGLFLLPILTPLLPWLPQLSFGGINPQNVLLGSVFLAWAIGRVLNRQSVFRPSRLGWTIGALMAVALLSVVRGGAIPTGYYYDARASAHTLFRDCVTFAIYFIALAMARGPRDRKILAWSVVLGLLIESVITAKYGQSGSGGRAVGTIGQSNELGAFLAMYVVMAAALLVAARHWFSRLVLFSTVALGTYAVLLSVSRGAFVALGVGLFYAAIRSSRAFTVILIAAVLTSPFWAPQDAKDRMTGTRVQVEGTDEAELEGSAQVRLDTWRVIITLVMNHPIDGVGFGGLGNVLPKAGEAAGVGVVETAHNTYLRFLAEMGIFGFFLFCLLLWKCWKLAEDARRAASSRFDRQLAVGLAASTLAMAVSCIFGDRFFSILVTGNFWMSCALVNDILLERREAGA
jgi:O-antigen ligase